MIVLARNMCPECRVKRLTCPHKLRGTYYVEKFEGTATFVTDILDRAMTFETTAAAERLLSDVRAGGGAHGDWSVVTI